ncbi:hypothetical protein Ancab_010128 [Ancistrocladus abbreviatus]
MVFNVSLGFQNLRTETKKSLSQNFSLLLADTVIVGENGPEVVTSLSSKAVKDVAYSFNEDDEEEEQPKQPRWMFYFYPVLLDYYDAGIMMSAVVIAHGCDLVLDVVIEVTLRVMQLGRFLLDAGITSLLLVLSSPTVQTTAAPSSSGAVNTAAGLNMAEALVQAPLRSQIVPQPLVPTQRIEELAVLQSKRLIPMTPSMPPSLVRNELSLDFYECC